METRCNGWGKRDCQDIQLTWLEWMVESYYEIGAIGYDQVGYNGEKTMIFGFGHTQVEMTSIWKVLGWEYQFEISYLLHMCGSWTKFSRKYVYCERKNMSKP